MVRETGTSNLSHSLGRQDQRNDPKGEKTNETLKKVSVRKLAGELDISNRAVVRILKQDLGYRSYKKTVQPTLTDFEKSKRMKFATWLRQNFRKEDTLRILFSDEILMACTMLKISCKS